ncbi:MAG: hypothetical protein WA981_04225 [Glaciecola sp.]
MNSPLFTDASPFMRIRSIVDCSECDALALHVNKAAAIAAANFDVV